jgi:F0F1-type ATP synthase membrane subunit b/b'
MSKPTFRFAGVSQVFASLRPMRFTRVALALVAGVILMLNTACSPSSPSVSGTGSYQEGRKAQTELYRPIQEKEGGMNQYSDTDPRRNTSSLDNKVQARVKAAERNLEKAQTPRDLADEVKEAKPLRRGPEDISRRVENTVEDLTDDISEGTQRGIKNLKRNVKQARRDVGDALEDAADDAKALGKDTARAAGKATDQARNTFGDTSRDVNKM